MVFSENRETFFNRITPFSAPSDIRLIEIAYMMAKFGHRSQFRKEKNEDGQNIRYFEHLRRTAIILMDELKIRKPELIATALVHDAVEDTKDVTIEIIEHVLGKQIATNVKLLSKAPAKGYYERLFDFGYLDVWIIKGCDNLDNLRSLKSGSIEFQKKQLATTRKYVYPLLTKLMMESKNTPYEKAGIFLHKEINEIVETFTFIDTEENK